MTQPSKPVVAEYICVPREPTREMFEAAMMAYSDDFGEKKFPDFFAKIYSAMLAASPRPAPDAGVIERATIAYNEIWQAAEGVDAHSADAIRKKAMTAALIAPAGSGGDVVERSCPNCEARDRDYWKPNPDDPFWMLEAEDGEWLMNEHSFLGTRDAAKAIRFPTKEAAHNHKARMTPGHKWWTAKATEHLWIEKKGAEGSGDAVVTAAENYLASLVPPLALDARNKLTARMNLRKAVEAYRTLPASVPAPVVDREVVASIIDSQAMKDADEKPGTIWFDRSADRISTARRKADAIFALLPSAVTAGAEAVLRKFHEAWAECEISMATGSPDIVREKRQKLIALHKQIRSLPLPPADGEGE